MRNSHAVALKLLFFFCTRENGTEVTVACEITALKCFVQVFLDSMGTTFPILINYSMGQM